MKKILVANRGEIAVRVIRSAKEMGIKTVAVFSEADRNALHVQLADEAVFVGPAPSNQSYLVVANILAACEKTGADAIHPGYGFLSENADFAKEVTKAGITFIGPSPRSIRLMGSKIESKKAVAEFNVPLVPGTAEALTDVKEAKEIAEGIGYPILIKASAGGGGKGMRIVYEADELESQMGQAIREATSAFGDGSVFIEKYITSPRHIEFQILGDQHGNIIHLFERECSIQRRHQKVVEEAPSTVLDPTLRQQMGEAAVNVAKSCGYFGAGTVEFILDETGKFYFLEMNTRLQVEHPVTEMITGIDLVKEQIKIARGETLEIKQEDLKIEGHAIELRVYAEDPANNFLPETGTLIRYQTPKGLGVRVDDGVEQGQAIPIYYDPMIAKLVAYDIDREAAIKRMDRAIGEYEIAGLKTTLPFGKWLMGQSNFLSGDIDTHFIEKHFDAAELQNVSQEKMEVAAKVALHHFLNNNRIQVKQGGAVHDGSENKWRRRRNHV